MKKPILGTTHELIYLHDQQEFYAIVLSMSQQASRHIRLFSHDLDPAIFDTPEVAEEFARLAISSPHVYIQLLLQDTSGLIQSGHHLLRLAQRVSSYLEIRVTDPMHQHILDNFYLFDDEGYVKRELPDKYAGTADYFDSRMVEYLGQRFIRMWERASPDPHLRRLHI
jgi:hypothetical protein